MTFEELQAEFHDQCIGALIYSEVEALARRILPRYNPQVYLRTPTWQDGLEEFVQDFVTVILLQEEQLEYVMHVAASLDDFRGLAARQMRRFLARRRRRTVVDNLLDRCKEIVGKEPFDKRAEGGSWTYTVSGYSPPSGRSSERALRDAAIELSLFPVVRADPSERAPMVYTTETLREILASIARNLKVWVTLADLDWVFNNSLTFLIPSDLSKDGEILGGIASSELNPEEAATAVDAATSLLESLTREELLVLRMKLSNRSDAEIAKALGVSRPTIDTRKRNAMEKLERGLQGFPEKLQRAVIERVSADCARIGDSDGT